ncbi:MAG: hypothetical protein WC027_00275 [Candidatus Paceibacterota bacterium]
MTNDKKTLQDELEALEAEAKRVSKNIERNNLTAKKEANEVIERVNEKIISIEKGLTDLDKIEEEAGDELDAVILAQAEDLATEE